MKYLIFLLLLLSFNANALYFDWTVEVDIIEGQKVIKPNKVIKITDKNNVTVDGAGWRCLVHSDKIGQENMSGMFKEDMLMNCVHLKTRAYFMTSASCLINKKNKNDYAIDPAKLLLYEDFKSKKPRKSKMMQVLLICSKTN
ncbi:MAG: hypothetical protein KAQ98_13560 [Bacteriovoracaceae bacterium]|nr:hypothetical protein [Bacteriovoracaceae bacterium]